jgi:hypothetical protein
VTVFRSRFTSLRVSRPSGDRASPRHLRERNCTSTAPKLSKTLRSRPFIPDGFRHFEGTDRSFAMYVAFLRSDYYGQFDCLQGLGVSVRVSPASFPLSFTSLSGSPVFRMEDSNKMMEVACC